MRRSGSRPRWRASPRRRWTLFSHPCLPPRNGRHYLRRKAGRRASPVGGSKIMKSKLLLAASLAVMVTAGGVALAKPDANQMAAVADKNRPANDMAADANRKPAEMLEFAGVKQGQTVVDLIPGGGY